MNNKQIHLHKINTKSLGHILIFISLFMSEVNAQNDTSIVLNKKRLHWVIASESVAYTGAMIGLGTIWYNDLGKFHLFNDNSGWAYMDKIGHLTTAQHVGRLGSESLRWAGVEEKKAIWYGGSLGLMFLTSVEIFDGMSEDWGFSLGDVAANVAGSSLYIGQELLWHDQRINMKWSYHSSKYAQYRPELLGSGGERILKDYNGQTYWISTNLHSFLPKSNLPPWLNIAVGYGIDGFTGADKNPSENSKGDLIPPFSRSAQWYLSPDIDFTKIKTDSKFLKTLFGTLNFVKFPAPTLELNEDRKIQFYWLFF
jgi:hypothetical protein